MSESRGTSTWSSKEGNIRSTLGLPLLTNDMSESVIEGWYLPSYPLLIKGDLFNNIVWWFAFNFKLLEKKMKQVNIGGGGNKLT